MYEVDSDGEANEVPIPNNSRGNWYENLGREVSVELDLKYVVDNDGEMNEVPLEAVTNQS